MVKIAVQDAIIAQKKPKDAFAVKDLKLVINLSFTTKSSRPTPRTTRFGNSMKRTCLARHDNSKVKKHSKALVEAVTVQKLAPTITEQSAKSPISSIKIPLNDILSRGGVTKEEKGLVANDEDSSVAIGFTESSPNITCLPSPSKNNFDRLPKMHEVELLAAVDAYLAYHGIVLVDLDLGNGWYERFLEWLPAQQKMRMN